MNREVSGFGWLQGFETVTIQKNDCVGGTAKTSKGHGKSGKEVNHFT